MDVTPMDALVFVGALVLDVTFAIGFVTWHAVRGARLLWGSWCARRRSRGGREYPQVPLPRR